jgi:hypothetical protein
MRKFVGHVDGPELREPSNSVHKFDTSSIRFDSHSPKPSASAQVEHAEPLPARITIRREHLLDGSHIILVPEHESDHPVKKLEALGAEGARVPSRISFVDKFVGSSCMLDASEPKKSYYTYPEFVFIGRHNVSVVQVVAPSTAKDAKKAFVIAWSEIDELWGNALDAHNVEEEEKTGNLNGKGPGRDFGGLEPRVDILRSVCTEIHRTAFQM